MVPAAAIALTPTRQGALRDGGACCCHRLDTSPSGSPGSWLTLSGTPGWLDGFLPLRMVPTCHLALPKLPAGMSHRARLHPPLGQLPAAQLR